MFGFELFPLVRPQSRRGISVMEEERPETSSSILGALSSSGLNTKRLQTPPL